MTETGNRWYFLSCGGWWYMIWYGIEWHFVCMLYTNIILSTCFFFPLLRTILKKNRYIFSIHLDEHHMRGSGGGKRQPLKHKSIAL